MYLSRVEEMNHAKFEFCLELESIDLVEYDGVAIRIKFGEDDCAGFDFDFLSKGSRRIFGC